MVAGKMYDDMDVSHRYTPDYCCAFQDPPFPSVAATPGSQLATRMDI